MISKEPEERLSKKEIEYLLRALRANVKAAKTSILGLEPKLRADFETELNTLYPLKTDPVWEEAFRDLHKHWEQTQTRVDARSRERGIPRRFCPSISQPHWLNGGVNLFKELRAELRRVAYAQIAVMVQERVEEHERESARVQLEILAHGCLTQVAKAFFDRLPKVEELFRPLTGQEVFNLMEGTARPAPRDYISDYQKRQLPEYAPDLGKEEDEPLDD